MSTRTLRWLAGVLGAAAAVLAMTLVADAPDVQAAPGPFQLLRLKGVCNSGSMAMADAIDAKLQADGKPDRMMQVNQPKNGETGFNDETVVRAMLELSLLLPKGVGLITAADITNNPAKVAVAVNRALAWRARRADSTLTVKDKTGNKVVLWCLKKNANHGGPDLGLLYIPNGKAAKDGVWIAGCVLDGGNNKYWVSYDRTTRDFAKFKWLNEGPAANPGEFIRYIYEFDVATNKLKITKQVGSYRFGQFVPRTTEVEKNPAAPPAEFKDLKLNGVQISLLDGGCGCPAREFVVAALDPVLPQVMNLTNPPLGGDGSAGDQYVSISSTIEPQSLFTVDLPEGTVYAGPGSNPYFTVDTVQDDLIALIYQGPEPLAVDVGAVFYDVARLAPAPSPSPSTSPSGPTPTASPTSGPTTSPSATPTASPPFTPTMSPTPTQP